MTIYKTLPIVHIGLPKAGSRTLQSCLFSQHPELTYYGQQGLHDDKKGKDIIKSILKDGYYEEQNLKSNIENTVKSAMEERKKLIISDENISFGQFLWRGQQWNIHSDHAKTARTIKKVLGDCQIIIILRNQIDWLLSMHRQGLKSGRYTSVNFTDWFIREMEETQPHLMALMHYDALYRSYTEIFGPDHVHIFFYEDYKNNFKKMGYDIAQICNIDPVLAESLIGDQIKNKSDTDFTTIPLGFKKILRNPMLSPIHHKTPRFLKRFGKRLLTRKTAYSSDISANLMAQIFDTYCDSNTALFDRLKRRPEQQEKYVYNVLL